MAEECITGCQDHAAFLMNSRESLVNGYLRMLEYVVKIRKNLIRPESLRRCSLPWRKENRRWDALIDIDTERFCDIDISIELTDVDIKDDEMFRKEIPQ